LPGRHLSQAKFARGSCAPRRPYGRSALDSPARPASRLLAASADSSQRVMEYITRN
jgi:hypothetical protein